MLNDIVKNLLQEVSGLVNIPATRILRYVSLISNILSTMYTAIEIHTIANIPINQGTTILPLVNEI